MFLDLYVTPIGKLYEADCDRCGCTLHAHSWAHEDVNERRDAMQAGTLRCDECGVGHADPRTFAVHKRTYAARYSADGYLDCTEWLYGTNRRELVYEVANLFGGGIS